MDLAAEKVESGLGDGPILRAVPADSDKHLLSQSDYVSWTSLRNIIPGILAREIPSGRPP
jgi:hypothetical protein